MECMQRKQDYKRWTFRSEVSAFAFLCFPLVLRWVFVCGFSAFVLHHYFLSSRYHVFSGLVSFQSTISFRRTWSLNDPACDAVRTNPRHELFRLDWNEPTQCIGRAVPAVAWLGGRKGAARSLPRPFSYDSNLFATACLSLRTLTGEAFLAEVLLNERISSSSKYRRVSTC